MNFGALVNLQFHPTPSSSNIERDETPLVQTQTIAESIVPISTVHAPIHFGHIVQTERIADSAVQTSTVHAATAFTHNVRTEEIAYLTVPSSIVHAGIAFGHIGGPLMPSTLSIAPAPNLTQIKNRSRLARRLRMRIMKSKRNVIPAIGGDNNEQGTYIDNGDPTYVCSKCNALMWYDERIRKNVKKGQPVFSQCCMKGKTKLPLLLNPPSLLMKLLDNMDDDGKHYVKNIRAFNSMFSFTSMGGQIDSSVNQGGGPYVFRMHGQNYHLLGSLLPEDGTSPKFLQLYVHDTDNEIPNRISTVSSDENSNNIDSKIVSDLQQMLDHNNPYCATLRGARQRLRTEGAQNVRLRLIGSRGNDGRVYNLPSSSEVAALIVGDFENVYQKRDIIVEEQSGRLQRISELHPAYLPLQYPLLFPFGEDGYRVDIPHGDITDLSTRKRSRVSMREFFSFRIHERLNEASTILRSKKLFQQFLVDAFTMIEAERLNFIRYNQPKLRSETYENVANAVESGSTSSASTGKRILLPSSFTGGSRYMAQNYMDAMALCKAFGYPDLFITFTCNPKWPEIVRYLRQHRLQPEDRPDILCRLFKIKLEQLITDLKDKHILGRVNAVVYTIEFQKRGLPHAHIILFMHRDDKLPTTSHIDQIISAEIPNPEDHPMLHDAVQSFMIHGPCGVMNARSPCMKKNKCSKNFPKKHQYRTTVDKFGYPIYKRQDNGIMVEKNGHLLDNRYVVPYNAKLLLKYQAHINVEWCNQSRAIKYLFKYINKGNDRVTAAVIQVREDVNENNLEVVDEIKKHYDCRYISPCEAVWRILSFNIHYRTLVVERLSLHLPGQQNVIFNDDDEIDDVVDRAGAKKTQLMAWMNCNLTNAEARNMTYVDFPNKFVWQKNLRKWKTREQGFSVGRMHPVTIGCGEIYYLRILLNIVKGPTCFEDIRTVDGVTYNTFKDACYALGLLDDDKEYIDGIEEASLWQTASYLRSLFAMLLMSNSLSKPDDVWLSTWEILTDDILYNRRQVLELPDLHLSEEQLQNFALCHIEEILNKNGSTLRNFSTMPFPDSVGDIICPNKLVRDERSYDRKKLHEEHMYAVAKLNTEQRDVYNTVMEAVTKNEGGVFFLYGHGGTGKTFIWSTLSAAFRSEGQIVLTVASSGIAALLLEGGRTAHSRFSIPLVVNEDSTCNIKPGTDLAELIILTKLIIWDEAPMINKHSFEALDKSLKDIMEGVEKINGTRPFGGKVIVFGGDFRQILPVIQKGSRQDIVFATINSSYLWRYCKVLRLTTNMRLQLGCIDALSNDIKEFSDWILKVGDGFVAKDNDGEEMIQIPAECLLIDTMTPIESIVMSTYPSISNNMFEPKYFEERAILAPTNDVVEAVNDYLLSTIDGEEREYLSSDSISTTDNNSNTDDASYSTEFLNSIRCSGLPNHKLKLKIGVPVMLLRNINQSEGLCNGSRLQITRLGDHIIEAKILTGHNTNNKILIPRIILTTNDYRFPINFQRRQFPLMVCFAMTINKSQGQSLSNVGLYLPKPVFSHGQLYVALSRVKSKEGLKVLIFDAEGRRSNSTINVVYKEVFQNI